MWENVEGDQVENKLLAADVVLQSIPSKGNSFILWFRGSSK